MLFARRVFLWAGIWGLVTVFPLYFLEARIGRDTPPPITHPEYYYGFIGLTLVFQFLFLYISRNPAAHRPLMLFGIMEKVSFGLAMPMLFAVGRIPGIVFVMALIDLVWAGLFAIAFGKTPHATATS